MNKTVSRKTSAVDVAEPDRTKSRSKELGVDFNALRRPNHHCTARHHCTLPPNSQRHLAYLKWDDKTVTPVRMPHRYNAL